MSGGPAPQGEGRSDSAGKAERPAPIPCRSQPRCPSWSWSSAYPGAHHQFGFGSCWRTRTSRNAPALPTARTASAPTSIQSQLEPEPGCRSFIAVGTAVPTTLAAVVAGPRTLASARPRPLRHGVVAMPSDVVAAGWRRSGDVVGGCRRGRRRRRRGGRRGFRGAASVAGVVLVTAPEGPVPLGFVMPLPNSGPVAPVSAGAPLAVASGNAYSFATGLLGSTWTPAPGEPAPASATAGRFRPIPTTSAATSGRCLRGGLIDSPRLGPC